METCKVIYSPGKFNNVIHPSSFLSPELGDYALIREGLAGKIIVPGMAKEKIVLEEINMCQNVIEDHHIQPIRVIVIVKRDGWAGIDYRLIGITGIKFILTLLLEDFHIMDPVILDRIEFNPSTANIFRKLHVKKGSNNEELVLELIEEAQRISRPRAMYTIAGIEKRDKTGIVLGGIRMESRVMSVNLSDVHRVFPYLTTSGREMFEWTQAKGDILEKYYAEYGAPLVEDLITSSDPLDTVVHRFLQEIAGFVVDKSWPGGCFAINSVVDCANHSTSLEALGPAIHEMRRAALVQRFCAAQNQGELSGNADPAALGEFFAGQVLALGVMGSGGANLKSLNQLIDVAMTALPTEKER